MSGKYQQCQCGCDWFIPLYQITAEGATSVLIDKAMCPCCYISYEIINGKLEPSKADIGTAARYYGNLNQEHICAIHGQKKTLD